MTEKKILPRQKVEKLIQELTAEEIIAPAVRFFVKWFNYVGCQSAFNLITGEVEEISLDDPERYEEGHVLFNVYPFLYSELTPEMIFTPEELIHITKEYGLNWQKEYTIEEICFLEDIDMYERLINYLLNVIDMQKVYADVDEQLDKIYNREQSESDINRQNY